MSLPTVDGVPVLLPPPAGYVVDFANPQRVGVTSMYAACAVGYAFALAFLFQRLYTKYFLSRRKFQLDDLFLMLSWAMGTTTQFIIIALCARGEVGIHVWELPLEKFQDFSKLVYAITAIYVLDGGFAKLSLLVFYSHLSPQTWYVRCVHAAMALVTALSASLFLALIFACHPMEANWNVLVPGSCINRPGLYIATAVANIVSDVILFVLPIPMVVGLQMSRAHKLGLVLIFGVGSLTVITSLIRVALLPPMLTSADQTWVIAWPGVLIGVESNLFVICCSLPTLRKFLRHVAPRLIGEGPGAAQGGNGEHGGFPKISWPTILTIGGSTVKDPVGGSGGGSGGAKTRTGRALKDRHRMRHSNYTRFEDGDSDERVTEPAEVHSQDFAVALADMSGKTRRALRPPYWDSRAQAVAVTDDASSETGIVAKDESSIVQTRTVVVEIHGADTAASPARRGG